MVPDSAVKGLVAPISLRAEATTPSPSQTCNQCSPYFRPMLIQMTGVFPLQALGPIGDGCLLQREALCFMYMLQEEQTPGSRRHAYHGNYRARDDVGYKVLEEWLRAQVFVMFLCYLSRWDKHLQCFQGESFTFKSRYDVAH